MKTYSQFQYDMQEGIFNNPVTRKIGSTYTKLAPLKNVMRFDNIKKLKQNPNMSIGDKATAVAGVIAPYSLPAYAKDILQLGKKDSPLDKGLNQISKTTTNITKGRLTPNNPKTDIGKKLGDILGFNKKKTIGQNELKGSSSNMS